MNKLELKCWAVFLVFLLIIASPFVLSGCKAKLPSETQKSEVVITETLHDTVFTEVPDSSSIQALIECQNNKPVIKQFLTTEAGKRIRPPALTMKANDIIQCDCYADSLKLYAFWKSKQSLKTTETQKAVLIEKQLTWWQKTWIALGKILTAAASALVAYKLLKNRLKLP